MTPDVCGDPFGTASLRAGVLAAWADSPTRFREDANAEEDLRLGGYADTWCVELAQNAADAARAAGVPGRLRIAVDDGELHVANTGAPLDAAGVSALAALRASAKRDDVGSVGRFGVGFAAVLALSDAPRVVTGHGGVAFSAAATAEAVRELPGPAAELARREGQLPVLRLVWPTGADESPLPDGYATEVRMPLRPGLDPEALLAAAADAALDLLLALPDLVEIAVGEQRFTTSSTAQCDVVAIGQPGRAPRRWQLARGTVDTATGSGVVVDAAVELRSRHLRTVCWALPLRPDGSPDPLAPGDGGVLHAPTATTERLGLPARLIADVPLDPDRRRVRAGEATDAVLRAAADAYLGLVAAVAPDRRLALVPVAGFPRSELDARLRELLLDVLRDAVWLPGAAGDDVAPRTATVLDLPAPELPALLAGVLPGLLAPIAVPQPLALLAELDVHRMGPAELADRLLGVRRPADWWRAVYAALEPAVDTVPGLRDELRALPVPLADGRTVPGPAGVLLPLGADAGVGDLALPGLHVVDPDAVHPLLLRLGAALAEPDGLLDHRALRDAVDRSVDDADAGLDPVPLAEAVLGLVAELGPGAASSREWLAALALTDVDGEPARADELMLPDAALRPLLSDDPPPAVLAPEWRERVSRQVLVAVGVLDGFTVVETDAAHAADLGLDDVDRWLSETGSDGVVAVRDLDLVRDDAWPAALALLAGQPETRAAVLAPGSYTAWWLARHARLHGRRPGFWRLPSATGLAALYDPLPACEVNVSAPVPAARGAGVHLEAAAVADDAVLAAAGVRAALAVADHRDAADLLARLADPGRRPDAALATAAHAALAAAVVDGRVDPEGLDPPDRVRALDGSVADVADAVVLDTPELLAVLPAGEVVVGGDPRALADLLDLPTASEIVDGEVADTGRPVPWGALPEVVVTCQALGVPVPDGDVWCHDELWVVLRRPVPGRYRVPTWRAADGRRHADDPVRALLAVLGTG
ncbi:MAG: ATP-binding protein [Pseudonocardia sp.]|nr:ATP-binding protein [Pseudonocardia sp.]